MRLVARIIALAAISPAAWSAPNPILTEGFSDSSYTLGASIAGLGSASAPYSASWVDLKNNSTEIDTIQAGLSYTHLTSGAALDVSGYSVLLRGSVGTTLDSSEDDRRIVTISESDTSAPLWGSFLLRKESGSGVIADTGVLKLRLVGGLTDILVGDPNNSGSLGIFRSTASTNSSTTPVVIGVTYLLVFKMTFAAAATDKIELFINPQPGPTEPTASDASIANLDLRGLIGFRLLASGHTTGSSYSFDEIRLGNAFEDVAPAVPEPSICSLLMAAVAFTYATTNRSRQRRR